MTAEGINSILGSDREGVEEALFKLVLEEKVTEVGEDEYAAPL
jgi:hypothetical protein